MNGVYNWYEFKLTTGESRKFRLQIGFTLTVFFLKEAVEMCLSRRPTIMTDGSPNYSRVIETKRRFKAIRLDLVEFFESTLLAVERRKLTVRVPPSAV